MSVIVSKEAVDLQKNRQRYVDCYNNKQSVFIGKDETRKRIFVLKSKPTNSSSKNDVLYIPVNIGKKITQVFANYEIGGGIQVDFKDQKLSDAYEWIVKERGFMEKMRTAMRKKSYVGYSVIRVRDIDEVVDGKHDIAIDIIPAQNYYPNVYGMSIGDDFRSITDHNIISEVTEMVDGRKELFAYIDSYKKEGNQRSYKREKYKSYGNGNKQLYVQDVGGFAYQKPIETIIDQKIQYLPLFIMNNEAEDSEDENVANNIFGQSDYRDIFELLQEYNDRYTQTSIEFIKHFDSAMSVPKSLMDAEQQRNRVKNLIGKEKGEDTEEYTIDNKDKIFSHGQGEQPTHYITKDLQTDKAISWIDKVISTIAKMTTIPVEFLTESGQAKQRTATEIVYNRDDFHNKVTTRQNSIKSETRRLIAYISSIVAGYDDIKEFPTISFVVPIPKDTQEQTTIYTGLRSAGLVSKRTAIKNIMGFDDEQADKELEELEKEEKITSEIMGLGNPQVLSPNDKEGSLTTQAKQSQASKKGSTESKE